MRLGIISIQVVENLSSFNRSLKVRILGLYVKRKPNFGGNIKPYKEW